MEIQIPKPLDRNLYLANQVDQESINKLTKSIIQINESDFEIKKISALYDFTYQPKPIKIYIDSYGGQVYQCFGLLSIIENSNTPIYTIVTGCAMSCGFLIAIHGNHRKVYENATLMYHQVSSGVHGTAKEIEEEVIEIKRLQEKIEDMTKKYTKINSKQLEKIYKKKKDWYLDAKDAVKWGCADEIV